MATKICLDVATDNLIGYKRHVGKMMKASIIKTSRYKLIANKLRCNNEHITGFAQRYESNKTAKFINQYVDKKVIIRKVARTSIDADKLEIGESDVILVTSNLQ